MKYEDEFFRRITPHTDPEILISMGDYLTDSMEPVDTMPAALVNLESVDHPHSSLSPSVLERIGMETSSYPKDSTLESLLADFFHILWNKRASAIRELERTGLYQQERAIRALCCAVKDESSYVRIAAIEVLGLLGEELPITLLVKALTDPEWNVRVAAAKTLGNAGKKTPIDPLSWALKREHDESVRTALVRSLGKQKCQHLANLLASTLNKDTSWMVREAAALALGELGEESPIKHLIYALRCDTDESVRAAAATALGQLGRPETEKPLLEGLFDEDEDVQDAAALALQQLDIETRGMKPKASLQWFQVARTFSSKEQTSPSWKTHHSEFLNSTSQENAFFTLADFMKDKKGYIKDFQTLTTPEGRILLVSWFYQGHGSVLQEDILPSIKYVAAIAPIEAAFKGQDEAVRKAVKKAIEAREERQWQDLLIVSFALSTSTDVVSHEGIPLRVILTGMSCDQVRKEDTPVLNQIVTAWENTLDEPQACQHPHNVADLKVWYQPMSSQAS